ncbi:MAG: Gfo/Idh/MocA family oxidoreductase [Clostridia bacterium]|nr:Gfo/Idh/MocA family oxidoreductase [Clostridia bacterium]
MNNTTAIKVGVLGYGGMAGYHRERMRKTGLYEFYGVYDTDPARQKAAQSEGMIAYPSAQALLSDKEIDVVLIATPNDWHHPYAIAAAKAGKHILCEKPVALSVTETKEMAQTAQEAGVVFSVHQNRRWDDDYIAARNIMNSGILGKIYRIDSFVCGANGIPGGWRKQLRHGGGMMLDWGVHLLDQIFDCIDARPLSLFCRYSKALGFDVDDGFDAQIGFDGALTVNVRVDTNTFVRMPRWILYGRNGTAIIDDWNVNGRIILPVYGTEIETVGIEAGNGFTKTMAYRPHQSVTEQPISRPEVDHDTFYKNFAAAVRGKEKPIVTPESVLKVMRIMELCELSDKTNTVIKEIEKEL